MIIECAWCHASFKRRAHNNRFCTLQCHYAYRTKKRGEKIPPRIIRFICVNCHEPFDCQFGTGAGRTGARYNRKYCSRKCCEEVRSKNSYLRMRLVRARRRNGELPAAGPTQSELERRARQQIKLAELKRLFEQYE